MTDKIKKIVTVVLLTLLIWTWAFLSIQTDITRSGSIFVAPAVSPDILVSFLGKEDRVQLKLTFRGSPAKVTDLAKRYRAPDSDPTKERLDFSYNPQDLNHDKAGTYKLDMRDFIRQTQKARDLALTVEDCIPETIDVQIEKLVEKHLTVQCIDENGALIKHENIEPAQTLVFVKPEYNGSANVVLTAAQQDRARKLPIREKPFVEVAPGKRRYAAEPVTITLPRSEPLQDRVVQPMIGFVISPHLQGKFDVELLNENDLKSSMSFKATDQAFQEYSKQRYHILIEIRDNDELLPEIPKRPVTYNFPPEFLRKGHIEPPAIVREAQIKLIPLPAPAPPAPGS